MDIQPSRSSSHQVGTLDLPPAHEPALSASHHTVSPISPEPAAAHVSQTAGILPTLNESHFGTQPEMEAEDLIILDDEPMAATNSQQLDGDPIHPGQTPVAHPRTMHSPELQFLSDQAKSFRIFLDICSGASRPLSKALISLHADVISFDILLDHRMDLLSDPSFESLLKLCASGAVAYGAASPPCAQYSRLKLQGGPGPPPLRTPEFLQGVPGLSASDLAKVQESFTMLSRCLQCLSVIHSSGGHAHLEQPSTAMSWLEPETQSFIKTAGIYCINLAACHFGKDWHKRWMFASSFPDLKTMGCTCPHPFGSHQPIAGQVNQAEDFLSRDTACYPPALASQFAEIILPLLSNHVADIPWEGRQQIIPIKSRNDFPVSVEDGGGLYSQPDWSKPERSIPDSFETLRKQWMNLIITNRLDKKLIAFCGSGSSDPPFSAEELQPFRQMLEQFFRATATPQIGQLENTNPCI